MGHWLAVIAVGAAVGLLGGMFGKGGSAVATPLLRAVGVRAIVAVAAPLPATIPATAVAAVPYLRAGLVDRRIVAWSLGLGVPATILGAVATRWIGGPALIVATEAIVFAIGLRFAFFPSRQPDGTPRALPSAARLAGVGGVVGVASGLLANSGGFLLAPLYLAVLRVPVKTAFACSLVVAAVLAVPGTAVHWLLGHIDWTVVAVYGAASIPMSAVGARIALRTDSRRLERAYGVTLVALSVFLLVRR